MRNLLLALALVAVCPLAPGAEIGTGDSREDVLTRLAKPSSTAKRGNREIFNYPGGGRIELVDGKVDTATGPLPPAPAGQAVEGTAPDLPEMATRAATTAPAARSAPGTKNQTTQPAKAAKTAKNAEPDSREAALKEAGIKVQAGPVTAMLGKVAQLKLPAGYSFVGRDDMERFYELTHNTRNGSEVGVVLGPNDWMLFFDYDEVGYVKDEEKDKLDAAKLMKAMTANEDDENSERKRRGWDAMKVTGWATPPHYDEKTNNLKWAINLASSRDNFSSTWINESIRILGRGGVMKATLVVDPPEFKAAEVAANKLLTESFAYVEGQKYSEFKKGDKIAAYGLTALVLGGAGAVALKTGLLANLGVLLAKMWKAAVAVVIVVLAGLKKFLGKILGARPEAESDQTNA